MGVFCKMKKNMFYTAALLILAVSLVALPSCSLLGGQSASSQQGTTMVYTAPPKTEAPTTEPPPTVPVNGTTEDENGVIRYYVNGELQTNTVVGEEGEQHYYVGGDGTVDHGYCDGVTVGEDRWIVIEGTAYPVVTESDEVLFAAAQAVAKCTDSSMKREDKLRPAFDYIKENYLEGVRHNPPIPYTEPDWPVTYASDILINGKGDCYSFGAAFAYMGRAMGFEESYAVNSGGHGWAEIENRTYDPEWSMHSNKYSYFGMRYDEECDVPYAFAIEDYTDQKRRQIPIN